MLPLSSCKYGHVRAMAWPASESGPQVPGFAAACCAPVVFQIRAVRGQILSKFWTTPRRTRAAQGTPPVGRQLAAACYWLPTAGRTPGIDPNRHKLDQSWPQLDRIRPNSPADAAPMLEIFADCMHLHRLAGVTAVLALHPPRRIGSRNRSEFGPNDMRAHFKPGVGDHLDPLLAETHLKTHTLACH